MEGQYNMRSPAVKRLMKEAQELSEPTEQYYAQPLEDNLFEWHFTIRGPAESDFNEGVYHGRIILPPEYPMKPPSIILLTPNGRFEVNKKICLSISGHHPESWQPSWSIRTALLAIIGFMPTHGGGAIGSLNYTPEERKVLARRSQAWRCPRCGNVNSVLKPVTEESEETRKEAQELASQIDFKGENKKPEQASSPPTSQSQAVPSSTSPSAQPASTPTSTAQPASTPTSTAQANGAVGGAVPAPAFAYYSPLMAGVYPGQAMPGRFPLPSQLYSQGGLGSSAMMFPLPLNPYAHVPMYPHGFPWPPPPSAFPPPGAPFPYFPPGMPAAAVPSTAAGSTPTSSPPQPTAPSQGVAGVSGDPAGGQQSPSTAAPSPGGSGAEMSAAGERSAAAQPPAAAATVPGAQTAEHHSQTAGRQTTPAATSPGLRQRRAQLAAAEYQAGLRGQEHAEAQRRNRLQPRRYYLNLPAFRILLGLLSILGLFIIIRGRV